MSREWQDRDDDLVLSLGVKAADYDVEVDLNTGVSSILINIAATEDDSPDEMLHIVLTTAASINSDVRNHFKRSGSNVLRPRGEEGRIYSAVLLMPEATLRDIIPLVLAERIYMLLLGVEELEDDHHKVHSVQIMQDSEVDDVLDGGAFLRFLAMERDRRTES